MLLFHLKANGKGIEKARLTIRALGIDIAAAAIHFHGRTRVEMHCIMSHMAIWSLLQVDYLGRQLRDFSSEDELMIMMNDGAVVLL